MQMSLSTNIDVLMKMAREGNPAAISELLEVYRAYLGILAKVQIDARLRGKVSESDVVQETMLRARQGFSRFRGQSEQELIGWLRKILVSRLTDMLRHYHADCRDIKLEKSLHQDVEQSSALLARGIAARQPSPSEQVQRRESAVLLADALARLPSLYREVVVLRHFENLSFPEVGQRMGRSTHSVKNMWVRSMVKLRELLGVNE
jgi:RNA polymerase sigma-70 factor (ECF subfamily)